MFSTSLLTHNRINRLSWVVVILFFAAVYAGALTFVYVEGDDASSVAYHVLGRNRDLQPPYSAYQAGADLILKPFPSSEPVVRITAIGLSSVAAICLSILMFTLAFDWTNVPPATPKWLAALVILLASPELFYLGLVYTPTVIALSLLLVAHMLLRSAVRQWERSETDRFGWAKVTLSAVLFGFGAACRWNTLLYGGVILADLILVRGFYQRTRKLPVASRCYLAVTWGTLAILVWAGVIAASGVETRDVFHTADLVAGGAVAQKKYLSILGAGQSLFTPAFIALGIWGWFTLRRQLKWLAVFSFLLIVVAAFKLAWTEPKHFLMFVPPLVLCAISGFADIWRRDRPVRLRRVLQTGIIGLVAVPWIFGLRATYGKSTWGPGFELRRYDQTTNSKFALTIGAGAAFPTAEGPRPLGGHAFVLFGGEWRRFNQSLIDDRRLNVETALEEQIPLVVAQGDTGYEVAELARMGFRTADPKIVEDDERGTLRDFADEQGQHVTLWKLALAQPEYLQDVGRLRELIALGGERMVVQGYPTTLRSIHDTAPDAVRPLGRTSAIVNLQGIIESKTNAMGFEKTSAVRAVSRHLHRKVLQ